MMNTQSLVAQSMLMALTGLACILVASGALALHTQNPAAWGAGAVLWLAGANAIVGGVAWNLRQAPSTEGDPDRLKASTT